MLVLGGFERGVCFEVGGEAGWGIEGGSLKVKLGFRTTWALLVADMGYYLQERPKTEVFSCCSRQQN